MGAEPTAADRAAPAVTPRGQDGAPSPVAPLDTSESLGARYDRIG